MFLYVFMHMYIPPYILFFPTFCSVFGHLLIWCESPGLILNSFIYLLVVTSFGSGRCPQLYHTSFLLSFFSLSYFKFLRALFSKSGFLSIALCFYLMNAIFFHLSEDTNYDYSNILFNFYNVYFLSLFFLYVVLYSIMLKDISGDPGYILCT